ncbi:hypothetical protein [Mariniphaga sediminis]|uniref:hypothetical protein n=1 Tax=Mariniphaga sediminis TaxID=1628158 RepID=UPI0035659747
MSISKNISRRKFCHTSGLAGLAMTIPLVSSGCASLESKKRTFKTLEEKTYNPRLIANEDGFTFLYHSGDDLGANDLKTYLSRWKDTNVDMVAYCVAFGGFVTFYQSSIADPIGTGYKTSEKIEQNRWLRNRERLVREAGDYIGLVFSFLKEMGIAPVASFRMNDIHLSEDPAGPLAGSFWKKNPQWRIGSSYYLDYAVPEVRDYLRQLINEVIHKFPDVAGIELDGMRTPVLFENGKGQELAPLLTELIRQIRTDLDAASLAQGKPRYVLRVNVPRSPELALKCGMDVATWDAEKLVDSISPGCYGTDFQIPIERWKAFLSQRTLVHAYFNSGRISSQYHSLEEYRGAAANAYATGADGVYLFNLPCFDEMAALLLRPIDQPTFPPPQFNAQCWHPDLSRSQQALYELDDPNNIQRKNKKFLFYTDQMHELHYAPEQADIQRENPQPTDLHFRCYEDYSRVKEIRIEIKTVSVSIFDQFSFSLNNQPIPSSCVKRLHAPGGRDRRIHATVLEPYSQYIIQLTSQKKLMQPDENLLTVTLVKQDPDVLGKIELREMELFVNYC